MTLDQKRAAVEWGRPELPIARQCELLGLPRSTFYYQAADETAENLDLMRMIDEQYMLTPFYGSRKMAACLERELKRPINRKRVQRLMREMGIEAIYPRPNTSQPAPGHKIYPYLLRDIEIVRPGQVWSADITYIPLAKGFAYLVAVIDWYSRYVLSWRLSNTMEAGFCAAALREALQKGRPEIFNTDQGSQFTSEEFTSVLLTHEIQISMDGRGRALDNVFIERLWRSVKYENVYVHGYQTMPEADLGLGDYFVLYNERRPHQSLGYATPVEVHYAPAA